VEEDDAAGHEGFELVEEEGRRGGKMSWEGGK